MMYSGSLSFNVIQHMLDGYTKPRIWGRLGFPLGPWIPIIPASAQCAILTDIILVGILYDLIDPNYALTLYRIPDLEAGKVPPDPYTAFAA